MASMDICEVRVLRRKKALLKETLPTDNDFLNEFLRQGLLDKYQIKNIAVRMFYLSALYVVLCSLSNILSLILPDAHTWYFWFGNLLSHSLC